MYIVTIRSPDIPRLKRQFEAYIHTLRINIVWIEPTLNVPPNQAPIRIPSPAPPDQEPEPFSLYALNDSCLLEIFNQPAISLMDLTALANTCTRFLDLARSAFPLKYERTVDINGIFDGIELWRADEYFKAFGDLLTTLDVSNVRNVRNDIVLRFALAHCLRLTHLVCKAHHIRTIMALRPLMTALHELDLRCYRAFNYAILFNCPEVYAMRKMRFKCPVLALPMLKMPHLTDLALEVDGSGYDQFEYCEYSRRHPIADVFVVQRNTHAVGVDNILEDTINLRRLVLIDAYFHRRAPNLVSIFEHFEQLETLEIGCANETMQTDSICTILQAIRNRVRLRTLLLMNIRVTPEIINDVCNVRCIKELKINVSIGNVYLMQLVDEMRNLTSITLWPDTIECIYEALVAANCLKKAKFKLYYTENTMSFDPLVFSKINEHMIEEELDLQVELHASRASLRNRVS